MFATRLNWTPDMVNELDPHFVDELSQRWAAEGELTEKRNKELEKQRAKNEAKRRR